MYVVETDAPCKRCGIRHEYVTKMCAPLFFESYADATWMSRSLEGSTVREVAEIPAGITRWAWYPDRRKGHLAFGGVR